MNELILKLMEEEIINEINNPEYEEFIRNRFKYHTKNILFNNEIKPSYNKGYISENLFEDKKNRCIACIYNNGSIRQCSNTSKLDNMCNKHYNIKNKYGYLIFGDINNDYRKHIRYNTDNCCAITFKNGVIDQCNKKKCIGELCRYHNTYKTKYCHLKYGSLI
jgi:hypothetical protein